MRKTSYFLLLVAGLMGAWVWAAGSSLPRGSIPVAWTGSDGAMIAGFYHPAKKGHYVWVLLHGLGSNKQEWLDFANTLAGLGEGFLIYDARGHGDSNRLSNGQTLDYRLFNTAGPKSQWSRMPGDLDAGIRMLEKRYALNPKTIAIGGASLGANVAVVYAGNHPEVPGLFLLSPGLVYAGVDTPYAFRRYASRKVFIAASPGDVYAYSSMRQLISKCPACRSVSGEGSAHGVQMFSPAFTRKLLEWMTALEATP